MDCVGQGARFWRRLPVAHSLQWRGELMVGGTQ